MENTTTTTNKKTSAVFVLNFGASEVMGFVVDTNYINRVGAEEAIRVHYNNEITLDATQYIVIPMEADKDIHDYIHIISDEVFDPIPSVYEKIFEHSKKVVANKVSVSEDSNKELNRKCLFHLKEIYSFLLNDLHYQFSDTKCIDIQEEQTTNAEYNNDMPLSIELYVPDLTNGGHDEGNLFVQIIVETDVDGMKSISASIYSAELCEYIDVAITKNDAHMEQIQDAVANMLDKIYQNRLAV